MHEHRRKFDPVEQSIVIKGTRVVLGICSRPQCPKPVRYLPAALETWSWAQGPTVPSPRTVLPYRVHGLAEDRLR